MCHSDNERKEAKDWLSAKGNNVPATVVTLGVKEAHTTVLLQGRHGPTATKADMWGNGAGGARKGCSTASLEPESESKRVEQLLPG